MSEFHCRRLPHLHAVERANFITWRLHGSLPLHRPFPPKLTHGQAFVAMDWMLDRARNGPLHLREPGIGGMAEQAIRYGAADQYDLHAYVVMANHVHLLITPHVGVSKITHSIKRFTAREANQMLGLGAVLAG